MSKAKRATRAFADSLDWSRFKGAKGGAPFQELATDLLFAKLGEDGFTPGPTHGGRDGGWDGLFQGRIAGFKGRWKIAAAVRADLAQLRVKAGKENQLAQRDRAQALLLLTPLDPNNRDCEDLEEVLGNRLKKGRI
jgi:hypothetical protein